MVNISITAKHRSEFISVLIPFRNESVHLLKLLNSLSIQDYDRRCWELILIDDHSEDQSAAIIQKWIQSHDFIQVTLLAAEGKGKKNAITEGVQLAKGEIILTTDADCELPSGWISSMIQSFDNNTMMVAGAVRMVSDGSIFSKLQAFEFSSLMGSGLALISLHVPIFCNGASLAYRKVAFEEVHGYSGNMHIASGDDEFLMRKIAQKFYHSVRVVNDLHAAVSTRAQQTLLDFIEQRLRWAGKWKINNSPSSKLLAILIFVFQVSWLISIFWIWMSDYLQVMTMIITIKLLLEGIFLYKVNHQFRQSFSLWIFLLMQIIYPIYVILIGLLSQFKAATWKGRSI